ncbi:MAG: DNA ligase [Brevibacillus sp.]|nr:DNA ligase [Brevibacillus sp.]
MLKPIIPMEPVSSDIIPQGSDWIAQIKWDGVRILTYFEGHKVRLYNRRLRERTHHYPEITEVSAYCDARSVILDGEVIALGSDAKPSFHEVMRRDGIRRLEQVPRMQKLVPVTYMIFDVLFRNGEWLHSRPLQERLAILAEVVKPTDHIQPVSSHANAHGLFEAVKQHEMEGIVLKQVMSPYVIGVKHDAWLKIKNYRDLIAVIGGFTFREGGMSAVLLGLYDEAHRLHFIGQTGAGTLTQQEWKALGEVLRLSVIPESPFVNKPKRQANVRWVRPMIPVKIKYAEWTAGRSLRQPTLQALVEMAPEACTFRAETQQT